MKAFLLSLLCIFLVSNSAFADSIVGVGMALEQKSNGQFYVRGVISGSPAERTRIMPGDQLVEVKPLPELEWVKVEGKTLDDVVGLIRGKEGTTVGLKLIEGNSGGEYELSIEREKIEY